MNAQQVFNVLWIASIYVVFSLGLSLVMGVARVLNLAHASILTWGGLTTWYTLTYMDFPLVLALAAGAAVGALLGLLSEVLVFAPLRRRGADELTQAIASTGLLIILITAARQRTHAEPVSFNDATAYVFDVGPIRATLPQVVIILVAIALGIALTLWLGRGKAGLSLRTAAYSGEVAAMNGVNVARSYVLALALGSGMAGLAGGLLGWASNQASYQMGDSLEVVAFTVIIVGGFGSVPGTFVAALVVALGETLSVVYLSSAAGQLAPFVLLVAVLLLRPEGIFPAAREESR